MRTILMVGVGMLCCQPATAEPPSRATLRARASLAIAFSFNISPSYEEVYLQAIREQKPLLVWVGQPVREIPGCLSHGCDVFPNAETVAVVIGLPSGGRLLRQDLVGRPSVEQIHALVAHVNRKNVPVRSAWNSFR